MLARAWIGVVLLALGVLGILDATGVLDGGDVVRGWWALAIVGLGLVGMIAQRGVSAGPLVVTLIGVALLAAGLDWVTPGLVWPAVLIVVGLVVVSGLFRTRPADRDGPAFAVLGGATSRNRSEHLRHADAAAVFGGATLDLREAHIDDRASVDAFALFGGVDVLVPTGWRISMGGLPVFGGYEDKTKGNGELPKDAPLLKVNATAVFGGVSVANKPD